MNKRILVIVAILVGIGLYAGGFFTSQAFAQAGRPAWMMGDENSAYGPGMMGNGQYGSGMMSGQDGGMMNGSEMMHGQYCLGMMANSGLTDMDPLSVTDVETAVTDYLATLNNDNLRLGEIMIFDNHAYAQILENDTGSGAFEVLIDPVTRTVFPEPGPNMMWNTEYGMMSGGNMGMMGGMMNGQVGSGMMGSGQHGSMMNGQVGSGMMGSGQHGSMMGGNMMGNLGYPSDEETSVSVDEAVTIAQDYLDAYLPGKTAAETADTFPGYYTLHILEDGKIVGMMSVNAYTGQVFPHHWHGEFVEMAGEDHS